MRNLERGVSRGVPSTVRRAFVGLAAVFALAIHAEAHAENLEKTEDISQLLEMTSFEETSYEAAMRNFELWIPAIRDKLLWSGVEEAHVQRVIALVSEEASIAFRDFVSTEMLLQFIGLYDETFSHRELKEIISFYETDTGRKVLRVTPALNKSLLDMGMQRGRELGEQVMVDAIEHLKEMGYGVEE